MEGAERQPGEEHLYREEKYAAKYEINMLRCIFCGLCEEACPKDAIYLSETFAPADYQRKQFIYKNHELRTGATSHVEIETYTFDVLPKALHPGDVVKSIAREYEWVQRHL